MARTGSLNNRIAFTGMASGLDTDSIIQATLARQKFKIDSTQKKLQLSEWKRDQYREMTSLLKGFQSQFMDVLNKTNFMMSSSAYKKYTSTTVDATGEKSTLISVTGNSNATTGTNEVKVVQSATAATATTQNLSNPIESIQNVSALAPITNQNNSFTIIVDGVSKTIELDVTNYNNALARDQNNGKSWNTRNYLQQQIDNAVGVGKVIVGPGDAYNPLSKPSDAMLTFNAAPGTSKIQIQGATALGLSANATNSISPSDTLQDAIGNQWSMQNGKYKININGEEFLFDRTTKVSDAIKTINSNTDAKVSMSYNELTNSFTFTAKQTGAGNTLDIQGMNNIPAANKISGQDAQAYINGTLVNRSTNEFVVNGLTYKILREPTAAEKANANGTGGIKQTVNTKLDVDGIFEGIKTFVDKYNEMVAKINLKVNEKYDKKYQPLTDEEKEGLSESQINKLEDKAKTGLLRRDSILTDLLSNMRGAFYGAINGVSGGAYNIGITTSNEWKSSSGVSGTLQIDEEKLKAAIAQDPDRIADIFNKSSSIDYSRDLTASQKTQRYNESGIMQRLKDIISDNITTSVNNSGKPGKLIDKAGIEGSRFDKKNSIFDDMLEYEKQIDNLWTVYDKREDMLRKKYANLESMMSKLKGQTNSLAGMLGQ